MTRVDRARAAVVRAAKRLHRARRDVDATVALSIRSERYIDARRAKGRAENLLDAATVELLRAENAERKAGR